MTRQPRLPILTLAVRNQADIVLVRQRARTVSELLGFETVDQTRIATAVSEIARNALTHGGGGSARFAVGGDPSALHITIEDLGQGAAMMERARPGDAGIHGRKGAHRGGTGIPLARRLMDAFEIEASSRGTAVLMWKRLPGTDRDIGPDAVRAMVDELMTRPPESLLEELHQQHQELLAVLEDLTRQQAALRDANEELEETNRGVMALYSEVTQELDDTNRGVVALYAQLDDQAAELRRLNALKDRFLSHLSHEFRTPLNSTIALSRLLADRVDGPLTPEQTIQVDFIRESAGDLLQMVNDLLDIAKIEAGRMEVRPEEFAPADLVGALRGMFRPLATEAGLSLEVPDPPPEMPSMRTDRRKMSQILRNLLANAIQYTPRGTVRMELVEVDGHALFTVHDTGVGIGPEDLDGIFQDFVQADPARRPGVRGTGLGLPIARELTRLLGGTLTAESELDRGSVFRVRVPLRLSVPAEAPRSGAAASDDRSTESADDARPAPRRDVTRTPPTDEENRS